MAVTTWNTGPAAARYRMSAKRSKRKVKSHERQAASRNELRATSSYERRASSNKRLILGQSSSAKHGVSR